MTSVLINPLSVPPVISLDEAAFEFSSANSARKCVNVSVNDDVVLGTNEMLTVAIATNNSYVVMETDVAIVTVVENEGERQKFDLRP